MCIRARFYEHTKSNRVYIDHNGDVNVECFGLTGTVS